MKRIIMILMAVALVALPTKAQSFGEQEQPTAAFQSTSTMTPTGSAYSANPALNADGMAAVPAAQGPAKAPAAGPAKAPGTLGKGTTQQPIGDPVLPLLLFAGAYLAWNLFRARKRAEER